VKFGLPCANGSDQAHLTLAARAGERAVLVDPGEEAGPGDRGASTRGGGAHANKDKALG